MVRQEDSTPLETLIEQIDEGVETAEDALEFISPLIDQDYRDTKKRCVLFTLNSLHFALPLDGVAEVGSISHITPLPHIPHWIQGVTSLRGEVLSIVDLGLYLQWNKKRTAGKKLLVIESHDMKVGLRIDSITGTANLDPSVDVQKDMVVSGLTFPLGCTVKERPYCYLDARQLLQEKKMVEYS